MSGFFNVSKKKDFIKTLEMETDILDNLMWENQSKKYIKKIDFIKIDVEGSDCAILSGGLNLYNSTETTW